VKNVAVFCASSPGRAPVFNEAAGHMGHALARQGYDFVYGGGKVGLMGVLADAMLQNNRRVYGVIPRALLEKEVGHERLTTLHVVETMHQRKAMIYDLSDAFIALPGGMGTLDELFETLTWTQLGLHHKPVGLLNTNGYFSNLIAFLDGAVENGFVRSEHRAMLHVDSDAETLLQKLAAAPPVHTEKWIDRKQI